MFAVIVHTSQNSAAKWRLFFLLTRKYVSVPQGPVSLFNLAESNVSTCVLWEPMLRFIYQI